jgi:hypothetical protein
MGTLTNKKIKRNNRVFREDEMVIFQEVFKHQMISLSE